MKKDNHSHSIAGVCLLIFIMIVILLAASCKKEAEQCDIMGQWECVQCATKTIDMTIGDGRLDRKYQIGATTVASFGYDVFTRRDTLYALPDGGGIYRKYIYATIGCGALELTEITGQIGPKEIFRRK